MTPIKFRTHHQARFSEMDPNGHLNSKHYFDYVAENRMIGHREVLGLSVREFAKMPFAVVARRFEIDFLKPIVLDQKFEVTSWIESMTSSSVSVLAHFELEDGSLAAKTMMILVSFDKKSATPCDWDPEFIRKFFTQEA